MITNECHSSVKVNLQNRNNLSTNEHFQGSDPCGFFILWVYAIVCFVIIPMITKNALYSNKEDFFTPKEIVSLMNNFYSPGVIQRLC